MQRHRWTKSLAFRFAAAFVIFTVITIALSALITYLSLTELYYSQCVEKISGVARELTSEMERDGETFASYQRFLLEHSDELVIGHDYTAYEGDFEAFERAFAQRYPRKVFEREVSFDELDEDLKVTFSTYYYKYWKARFTEAREAFNLPYTYYIRPTVEDTHIAYIIDPEAIFDETPDGERLRLVDDCEENFDELPVMLATWESGTVQDDVDVFNNEYGHTCAFYQPLSHEGDLLGLVCVEGDVGAVNRDVLLSTINLVLILSLVVIVGVILLVIHINRHYVAKLTQLNMRVEEYAREKNSDIATQIESDASGADEIALLSLQIASMICELQNHIDSIMSISGELSNARDRVAKLNELAETDAMTGLLNKRAFTDCAARLDEATAAGGAPYALVMIDLNYLKRINDEYGHDKGDAAIRRLADIGRAVFAFDHAYRIGGDEFCVVLEGEEADQAERKVGQLMSIIDAETSTLPWEHISAATGIAHQQPGESFDGVFKRADANMYANKKAMKAQRKA